MKVAFDYSISILMSYTKLQVESISYRPKILVYMAKINKNVYMIGSVSIYQGMYR